MGGRGDVKILPWMASTRGTCKDIIAWQRWGGDANSAQDNKSAAENHGQLRR